MYMSNINVNSLIKINIVQNDKRVTMIRGEVLFINEST